MKLDKNVVILLTFMITGAVIYFSIPFFITNDQIMALINRVNTFNPGHTKDSSSTSTNNNSNTNSETNTGITNKTNSNTSDSSNTSLPNSASSSKNSNSNSSSNHIQNTNPTTNTDGSNPNQDTSSTNNSSSSANENPENNTNIETSTPKVTQTFVATFIGNGSTVGASTLSCSTTESSCSITMPLITSSNDVIGWGVHNTDTTSSYQVGDVVTITGNTTFYAITKKLITVTVDGNGAYEGNKNLTCIYYNTSVSCNVTLPNLEKDYYTSIGFNEDPTSASIIYNNNQIITVNQNKNLYAIRKIDTTNYDRYRNTAMEVFNRTNELRVSKGLKALTFNKSLELSAMLRVSEIEQNYDFNVNGDYHYRISNQKPFYTVNTMAVRENYYSVYQTLDTNEIYNAFYNSSAHYDNMVAGDINIGGFAVGFNGTWYYIVELFGGN